MVVCSEGLEVGAKDGVEAPIGKDKGVEVVGGELMAEDYEEFGREGKEGHGRVRQ